MYGGLTNRTINTSQQTNNEPVNLMKKSVEDVEPPTALDNLKKTANIGLQIANNIGASGLEYIEDGVENLSETIGIDPNASVETEVKKFAEKTKEIGSALKSEAGQEALSNLGTVVSEVTENVVAPGLTKIADSVISHSGEIMKNSTNAAMDAFSATPIGPLLDLPRFASDIARIAENSTSMVSDVLDISKDTIEKSKESKDKLEGAFANLKSVIDNGNKLVSSGLDNIKESVDSYGKNIVRDEMKDVNIKSPVVQVGGGLLKKLKKEAEMVGGRINQSRIEFLSQNVNSSQIKQKYNQKYKTKRRYTLKRKTTSRRR